MRNQTQSQHDSAKTMQFRPGAVHFNHLLLHYVVAMWYYVVVLLLFIFYSWLIVTFFTKQEEGLEEPNSTVQRDSAEDVPPSDLLGAAQQQLLPVPSRGFQQPPTRPIRFA